jgi:exodeoxyribonuclease-5
MNQGTDKQLSVDDLSIDQALVYEYALQWLNRHGSLYAEDPRLLTIGGLAGTGKSTLLGVIASTLVTQGKTVAYVTITGRASSVLRRKLQACGVDVTQALRDRGQRIERSVYLDFSGHQDQPPRTGGAPFCGTAHRLLYIPIIDKATEELKGWTRRSQLDRDYDVIVLDEASMMSREHLADLRAHNVPILAVGDHGQLPPVMSEGSIVEHPTLRLEKIHRQARDNPILRLAHMVRMNPTGQSSKKKYGTLSGKYADGERVIFERQSNFETIYKQATLMASTPLDIGVICWMNKTRCKLNAGARGALGLSGPPKKGEPVICLKNEPPVFNGMRGILTEDAVVDGWNVHARIAFPEEGLTERPFRLCGQQFFREKPFADVRELWLEGVEVKTMGMAGSLFDFGYALTAHKVQGSAFEHAIVYVDRHERPTDSDWRRWAYTAVTRASHKLTVLV